MNQPQPHFSCFKFATKPELARVAAFLDLAMPAGSDPLILSSEQIRVVLKENASFKYVWLFHYGCICFLNFEAPEIYRFLKFLEATCGADYHLFSTYNESYRLQPENSTNLAPEHFSVYAHTLAKSTELKYLEETLNSQFDQSEVFINELHKGWFSSDNTLLKKATIRMVEHQLKVLHSLRILDRPSECNARIDLRQRYDVASAAYDLQKRFAIIQKKLGELHGILTPYQKINYSQKAKRLITMEVLLLTLFPLPHLLKLIIPKILTFFANM